mgnify:CR=1 FL=1
MHLDITKEDVKAIVVSIHLHVLELLEDGKAKEKADYIAYLNSLAKYLMTKIK